ncbi:MAG: hypothetical protein U9Q18_03495 [Caldisericota bacterium]|nr:hypothetical protein [Caldisericota bacterium]
MKVLDVKLLLDKESQIFGGRIGSGKTEIAVNIAIKMSEQNIPNVLFDMDIVKPYVRIRDIKNAISMYDVEIVSPPDITRKMDLPIFPPHIISKLMEKDKQKILDIGGDPYGAGAITQFKNLFLEGSYNFFFVVNTKRPETSNTKEIIEAMAQIQDASKLTINALVFNTHLRWKTTEKVIRNEYRIVKEVSEETKIPIYFACVDEKHQDLVRDLDVPILPLKLFVKPLPRSGE